jgi:putative ABC transport system permease protein
VGRLFVYHLRLAARSLRRNTNLAFAMFLCLGLAAGLWASTIEHFLRFSGPGRPLPPGLHQVELPHTTSLGRSLAHTNAEPSAWAARTRVSFPEYELLAGSGVARRQTATVRSRLLVAADQADAARIKVARFVDPDFFALFAIPIGEGRPFTAAEVATNEPVVVLGEQLARALGAGRSTVGRTFLIEGKPFRVVGVVAGDQPFRPDWDFATMGGMQDAAYLPFGWFRGLLARPETVVLQNPVGPGFDDLLRSDAVFVTLWTELPTDEARAAYAAYLAERLGRRGVTYTLRSLSEWRAAFPVPPSTIGFFAFLCTIVLLGAGFNMARLLLAKGLARRDELGVHRALGASRRSLFARQMLEGGMVALPAALAGTLMAVPIHLLFNHLVGDTDVPVHVTALGFVSTIGATLVTSMLAAVYPAWQVSRTPPTVYMGRT